METLWYFRVKRPNSRTAVICGSRCLVVPKSMPSAQYTPHSCGCSAMWCKLNTNRKSALCWHPCRSPHSSTLPGSAASAQPRSATHTSTWLQDSRGRLMAAKFPDGIEHAVQAHRAASMALPDAHNPSQASFPGDPDDSAARSQALHPHPATHSHARRTLGGPRNHHHYSYHGHNGEHLSVTSQPTNSSRVGSPFSHYEATMHEHDRKFAYQSQIQEDRNYALALAHDAPSSEIPVIRSGVLPHSVLLSSKLSSARSGQRAYILIPPLLNAILLGGVPLPPPVVLAASHLCPLTRGGGGGSALVSA